MFYQLVELCSFIPLGGLEIFWKCFLVSVEWLENQKFWVFFIRKSFIKQCVQGFSYGKIFKTFDFQANLQKKNTFSDNFETTYCWFQATGKWFKKKVQFCFKNEKMWFYGRISCWKHPRSVPDPFRDSYSTQNQKITIFFGFLNFALKFLYIS